LFVDVNNQAIQVTLFGNAMFEKYVESSVLSLTSFMVCPEAKNAFWFKTNKANLYLLSNSICSVKLMESISSFPKQVMQITIYGCVETQDRGSLHIHMLIWIYTITYWCTKYYRKLKYCFKNCFNVSNYKEEFEISDHIFQRLACGICLRSFKR